MTSVAVIDGSRVFAEALAARLSVEPDIRVVHCSTCPATLRSALARSSVDVLVYDAALFNPEARDGVALVQASGVAAVVLVAGYGDLPRLRPAFRSGVRGWVPRDASAGDLVAAVRAVSAGGTWIPPRILTDLLKELMGAPSADDVTRQLVGSLTPREREVLACLADGLSRAETAVRLHLSVNTVRTHVQSVLSKLGVNSSVAAVALARRAGTGRHGHW